MTLYEISNIYNEILEADIPDEALIDTLDGIQGDFKDKADNIACFIKSLKSDVIALKAEAKNLTERARTKENKIERLKDYLSFCMNSANIQKIETPRNVIHLQKKTPALNACDGFIEWAVVNAPELIYQAPPVPRISIIKEHIKNGENIPNIAWGESERLAIK